MREIKFRAMSMCKGEHWLYGDLRHYNRNPHTEKWTIHDPNTGIETDIDETTIGQFTGLKDKNGKEIYEGDVLNIKLDPQWDYLGRFLGKTDIPPYLKAVVRYNERMCRFELLLEENEQCGDHHLVTCEIGLGHEEFLIVGKFIEMPFKLEIDRSQKED